MDQLLPVPPFFRWRLILSGRHSATRLQEQSLELTTPQIDILVAWPRGRYEVEALWCLEDVFGFTRLVPAARWRLTVTIPPHPVPYLPPRPPATRPGPWKPRRAGRRAGDPFDVRPYTPGDDLRRLHWPLFAHSGTAFVRTAEPSPPPTGHEFLVLDTAAPSEEVLDDRLGRLVAWLDQLDQQGTGWTLTVPADSLVVRSQAAQALAGLSPQPLPDDSVDATWPETVTLITGPESPAVTALVRRLAASRRRLRPIFVDHPGGTPSPKVPWWTRR